ncbi:MAG TPA: hypothetical protein QGH10_08795, partial [Armatimonadota bacterium]|nr:hypothetical protein [Armatimonadota bacterium]
MTGTLRRAGQFAIIAILLAAFTLNIASAATIKLGSVREQTINWLMESKHLSPAAAEQSLRHYERQNRSEILDTIGIPDGAVADFVTVDGESGTVTEDGCGLIFSPGSEYGRKFWQQVESTRGTPAYDHLKANMARAVEQGVFVQKLTQEQQQRIQDVVAGRHRDRPSLTPTEVRVLVIGTRMPQFDDFSPTPTKVLVAELLAAATPNGNLVNIDYTAYDEAAQVDVAGYEIYFETATGPTAGLSPIAAVGPGTQTLQLPTGGPGPDRYVAVAVPDEVPNVETPVNWVLVTTADTAAPLLTSPNPFDGQTEVALGANISFRVEDAGSGVAAAAISVRIKQDPADGGAWTDIT